MTKSHAYAVTLPDETIFIQRARVGFLVTIVGDSNDCRSADTVAGVLAIIEEYTLDASLMDADDYAAIVALSAGKRL